MAGIFGWASNVLDTVKNTVVSPFVTETPTFQVKQGPAKQRPASKPGSKKKKKGGVNKAQQRKNNKGGVKSVNSDDSTDSDPEESPANEIQSDKQKSPPSGDEVRGHHESEIVMVGDETENRSAEEDDDEGEDDSSNDEGTVPPTGAISARALKAKEKSKKRQQRYKLKMKEKKALLANSLVKNLPADELEEERKDAYTFCSEKLSSIQTASAGGTTNVGDETPTRMLLTDSQRALSELSEKIDEFCRTIARKTPRVEDRSLTSSALKKLIQNMELSEDRDEAALNKRVDELIKLISIENQKGFQRRMDLLKETVEAKKREKTAMLNSARIQEATQRILSRFASMPNNELKDLKESDLHNSAMELSTQMQPLIFVPFHLNRKIERKFGVIIDNQPFPPPKANMSSEGGKNRNEGKRPGQGASSRNITIWGPKENVDKAVAFITLSDQDGVQRKTFEKKVMGTIIGKGGSGLNQIENTTDAFVIVDGIVDVIVIGPPQIKSAAWQMIDKMVNSQQETLSSVNIPISITLARAIQSLHKARVQALEQELKGRIILIMNPQEQTPPFIVVKAKAEQLDKAKVRVMKELVDEFRVVELSAPARAVTRLLSPPRSTSETSELRLVHEEFRIMRESMALYVRRSERPDSNDSEDEKNESGLVIVCHKMDEDTIRKRVGDLIERASYLTERIPIEREQLRIFTPDTRALIESSSHCRFAIQSGQNDSAVILLTGSSEALVEGKALITDILQKKGGVVNHKLSEVDVIPLLLKDKGTKIRALQYTHNVAITIDRKTATVKIVGDEQSTEDAVSAIEELCAEIRDHKANLETLQIEVDSSAVAQIIGRGGSNINEIRNTSGVDSIDIPRQGNDGNSITVLTIVGTKESVAAAEKMIQRIVGNNRPSRMGNRGSQIAENDDDIEQQYTGSTGSPSIVSPEANNAKSGGRRSDKEYQTGYPQRGKHIGGGGPPHMDPLIGDAHRIFAKRLAQNEEDIDESNFPSIESAKKL